MYNKMNHIFDYFGLSSFSLGVILGIRTWIINIDYPLWINIFTLITLFIGSLYGIAKFIKYIKNWNK